MFIASYTAAQTLGDETFTANKFINQKHWDSAYLRQGTSYQCRDINPAIWRIGMNERLDGVQIYVR